MPGRGVFIAGTDTGIGKTLIACALLRGLADAGLRTVGMKPVAAGAHFRRGTWYNDDVELLRAAANVDASRQAINPYCFAPAIAPHIAALEAGIAVSMSVVARNYARLAALSDIVVVEGVGGLLVPLGPRLSAIAIPQRLNLPVVLVVGLRLGCLNHALLAAEVAQSHGLRLAGWIANAVDPAMARRAENIDALRRRIPAPLLGVVKNTAKPDAGRVARALDIKRINAVI